MLTEICIDSCINIYVDAVYQWYEIQSGRWTITKNCQLKNLLLHC